jgi:N-acetylmuramoyl-L-alanine amidase
MREIDTLIIHCSATKANQKCDKETIDLWHRQRGWRMIGYHYVINRDGKVEEGRSLETVGAHAKGYNKSSVGICMCGGLGEDGKPETNFTKEQWDALAELVYDLERKFPEINVIGHNEVAPKACPTFNVQEWKTDRKPLNL